jgi:hypothetical protein
MKTKKSQSEVITTVLLILIGLTAVVLIASFVINLVKNNLKNTDCVHTTGQINIDTEKSFFNNSATGKILRIAISRGEKEFNITKLGIIYGTSYSTSKKIIEPGSSNEAGIVYIRPNGSPDTNIIFPDNSELKVYEIPISNNEEVETVGVEVFINNGIYCGKIDEKKVTIKTS